MMPLAHRVPCRLAALAVLALGLLAVARPARAAAFFDDPRFQQWASDYLAGRDVRAAVERDLKGPEPHPLAAYVWIKTIGGAALTEADPAVSPRLKPCADVVLDYEADRLQQALDRVPPARAAGADACTLIHAVWAADRLGRAREQLAYLHALTQRWSDGFFVAWQYSYLANSAYPADEALRGEIAARAPGAGSPTGVFVRALMPMHGLRSEHQLSAVEAFLRDRPRDAWALQYRAEQIAASLRYEAAAKAAEAAFRADPFGRGAGTAAQYWVSAEREDLARALIKTVARLRGGKPDEIERREAEALVAALSAAGERGRAREEVAKGLARWPGSPALQGAMADLELAADRPAEAVAYAKRAFELQVPTRLETLRRWMEALRRAGRPTEAYDLYARETQAREGRIPSLLVEAGNALSAMDRKGDRVALLEQGRRLHPDSIWIAREHAEAVAAAGRKPEALAALRGALERDPTWGLHHVAEWSASKEAADAMLADLRARSPWAEAHWTTAASRVEGDGALDRKLAVWREARAKNPNRLWAYEQPIVLLHGAERWADAEAMAREAMRATLAPGDDVAVLLELPWTVQQRAGKTSFDTKTAEEGLRILDAYRDRGGNLSHYYRYRAELLHALARKDDAIQAGLAWARMSPDETNPLWFVANEGEIQKGWAAANRHLRRDPWASGRLTALQALHVLYGGSPIVGLWLGHLLEERQPNKLGERRDAKAWEQLGDAARTYELTYRDAGSVSTSDRYIGWYDRTRHDAQKSTTRVGLPFDAKSQAACPVDFARKLVTAGSQTWAVICHESGDVVVREDDPQTGKIRLLQRGATFVRYTYDEAGKDLRRIDASSGEWVALDYDAAARIKTMRDSQGKQISFEYNDRNKPTRIAVAGKGEIRVTYRPNSDEIEKTDSPQGRAVALEITSAFQRLLDLTRPASGSMSQVPELPRKDARGDDLRGKLDAELTRTPRSREAITRARLALAAHLVEHVRDTGRNAPSAESQLRTVLSEARAAGAPVPAVTSGLDAAGLWYRLKLATRPAGLSAAELEHWGTVRGWLEAQVSSKEAKRVAEVLKLAGDRPLGFMETARWLPRSALRTPGPWRRHPLSKMLPEPLRTSAKLTAAVVRANGHVVVGTSRGLLVLRRGFWEWWGFDESLGVFSSTMPYDKATSASEVLSLAEDAKGTLYVGTAAGLHVLKKDYDTVDRSYRSTDDGLPSPRIAELGWSPEGLLVGTSLGLRRIGEDGAPKGVTGLEGDAVSEIAAVRVSGPRAPAPALVVTNRGLFALANGKVTELAKGQVEHAAWYGPESRAVFVQGRALWGVRFAPGEPPSPAAALSGPKDVVAQKQIHGIALLPVDRGGGAAAAVLTDLGLSLYRDAHLEHLDLKDVARVDRVPAVTALAALGPRAVALTSDGAYVLELDRQAVLQDGGEVKDLLTLDDLGMTLVAREWGLRAIRHDVAPPKEEMVDDIAATALARHPDGGWVTNDGDRILRYNPSVGAPAELFEASPSSPAADPRMFSAGPVKSILVSSDRAVWVVSGSYLFRFKDGVKQEFSTAIDPAKFPARSEMLSRVVETIDGRVWVIASNEGHLVSKGITLSGGVVEWTGDGFRALDPGLGDGWFIRSYTPIDKTQAIVGTSSGFARHRSGRYELFSAAGDPSYKRLKDAHPSLHLGTRGARLGGLWLFGAAGGVVAWKDGTWFYPDRLNWMLPAQGLALYGARHVRAVETDRRGRVYVATDHGLLVYDSGGGDPAGFLLTNELEAQAFADAAAQQLQAESDVLVAGLSKGSALADRIARMSAARKEIEETKALLEARPTLPAAAGQKGTGSSGAPAPPMDEALKKKLEDKVREKERALNALLLQLEREQPGVHQMLELKPIDLASLRDRLEPDQIILQYLPTDTRLFIQVVTKTDREVREVEVKGRELLDRALRAANRLGGRRDGQLRGLVLERIAEEGQPPLVQELAWLYRQLLYPVEGDIASKKYVYVVPTGELTYLPFGALVRQAKAGAADAAGRPVAAAVEYAAQRTTFGYLTSLYMFDLMLRNKPTGSGGGLVLGDPDGSLPGAREEARRVASMMRGSTLRVGGEATYESLVNGSGSARVLHFATHGLLDHHRPERSSLLLANKVLLTVPDAMTLKLRTTDLVVLSACNTGIGRSGMEYASLARAFMNAGTASVLATLWSVDDEASKRLMQAFYAKVEAGEDRLSALAAAQRQLIADPKLSDPSMWASYIAFGHP